MPPDASYSSDISSGDPARQAHTVVPVLLTCVTQVGMRCPPHLRSGRRWKVLEETSASVMAGRAWQLRINQRELTLQRSMGNPHMSQDTCALHIALMLLLCRHAGCRRLRARRMCECGRARSRATDSACADTAFHTSITPPARCAPLLDTLNGCLSPLDPRSIGSPLGGALWGFIHVGVLREVLHGLP